MQIPENIPEDQVLVIEYPKVLSMMCGIKHVEVDSNWKITVFYEDDTTQSRECTRKSLTDLLDSVFSLVKYVQK